MLYPVELRARWQTFYGKRLEGALRNRDDGGGSRSLHFARFRSASVGMTKCRERGLFHLKTQVGQAVAAFYLDNDRVAGLQCQDGGAQTGHVGDGSGVEGVDDVAGL